MRARENLKRGWEQQVDLETVQDVEVCPRMESHLPCTAHWHGDEGKGKMKGMTSCKGYQIDWTKIICR